MSCILIDITDLQKQMRQMLDFNVADTIITVLTDLGIALVPLGCILLEIRQVSENGYSTAQYINGARNYQKRRGKSRCR